MEVQKTLTISRKRSMATKKAKDKAVKKVEKAVRKAVKKGADPSSVEQAVELGMDKAVKQKSSPPKKQPVSVKADGRTSKGRGVLKQVAGGA
jgi:hypothetical protein